MSAESVKTVSNYNKDIEVYVFLSFLANSIVNWLSMAKIPQLQFIFGKKSIPEVSHQLDTAITPADYTFAIWSLIYTMQFVLTITSLVVSKRMSINILPLPVQQDMIIALLASISWVCCFGHFKLLICLFMVMAMAISWIRISYNIYCDQTKLQLVIGKKFYFLAIWTALITATWSSIAVLLNLNIVMIYLLKFSQEWSCKMVMILLFIAVTTFFTFDFVISGMKNEMFVVYLVVYHGLLGIVKKGQIGTRTEIIWIIRILIVIMIIPLHVRIRSLIKSLATMESATPEKPKLN